MAIQTRCPKCETSYTLADSQRGKKVRCRKCTDTFVVGGDDEAAAAGSRVRKDALQTSPQPPARTPPPKSRPPGPRRDKFGDRDDEDDGPRRRPDVKKKSGSAMPIILMVGGGLLLLFLLCGGAAVIFVYWGISTSVSSGIDNLAQQAQNGDPNNPFGIQLPDNNPKDVGEALAWLKTGDVNKQNAASEWLSRADVDDGRRKEVAAALENVASNQATRDAGIQAFARWAGPENVPALIRLADKDDQWIFNKKGGPAADALVRLGDESAIPLFARRLETDAHADAAERLTAFGAKVQSEVLKYMDSPKGDVFNKGAAADEARKLLKASCNTGDDVMLTQAVTDLNKRIDSGYLRCAAEYVTKANVVEARRTEVAKALENALSDKDGQTRKAAAVALQTWGTKNNVTALIAEMDRQGLGDSCEPCMMALAAIKDESGAEAVAKHLTDIFHKDAAFNALRAMGPAAAKAVAPYLTHRDAGVRQQASLLLKGYNAGGDVKLDAYIASLGSADADQRREACDNLAREAVTPARQKDASAALAKLLDDPDPFGRVQNAAAKALAVWGDKDSVPALIQAMEKPNQNGDVWQTVVDVLVKLKDERAVVPLLLQVKNNVFKKDQAKKALIQFGPVVETALDDVVADQTAQPVDRVGAIQLLSDPKVGIGTAKSLPVLQDASKDANADVKRVAAAAYAALKRRVPPG